MWIEHENRRSDFARANTPHWQVPEQVVYNLGFLQGETGARGISAIDTDLQPLVRALYSVPGVASFAPSCAGHFDAFAPRNNEYFWPRIFGRLPIAFLLDHPAASAVAREIDINVSNFPDAQLLIKYPTDPFAVVNDLGVFDSKNPKTYRGSPPTANGAISLLEVRIGDDRAYDLLPPGRLPDQWVPHGRESVEFFNVAHERWESIRRFWSCLADRVSALGRELGYTTPDYQKLEFQPFR